ncbi:MAG: hypothetical protein ACJAUH_000119, partial [Saprospiraceae bacterium]
MRKVLLLVLMVVNLTAIVACNDSEVTVVNNEMTATTYVTLS